MVGLRLAVYFHLFACVVCFSFEVFNNTYYRVQYSQPQISKRNVAFYDKEVEVCPTEQKWISYATGETIDNKEVQLVQDEKLGKQWFYTVKCVDDHEGRPCRLIDPTRHRSKCITRYNLVPAVIWGVNNLPDWSMIRIPSQCVCLEIQTIPFDIPNKK